VPLAPLPVVPDEAAPGPLAPLAFVDEPPAEPPAGAVCAHAVVPANKAVKSNAVVVVFM